MAFTDGEYIEKFVLPALLHNLRNLKQDFLAVIPNAPRSALNSSGIQVHKVGNPIAVDWDKTTAYGDNDLKRFLVQKNLIEWEYFSTTPFVTDKEEIRTSALNRGGILQQKTQEAIVASWIAKNIHVLAPDRTDDSNLNPIEETSGANRGDGTKKMTVEDLIKFMEKFSKMNLTRMDQLYMILSPEHLTDLCLDALGRQTFRDIFVKTKSGEPIAHYGWNFFVNNERVLYSSAGDKKAIGAAVATTDRVASVVFYAPHTIKGLYNIAQHMKPMSEDTRQNPPRTEMRLTGNAVVGKLWKAGFGAIKSATA